MEDNNLFYSTPESQGVRSETISEFLDELTEKRLPMHSFMLIKRGTVIAEGYWKPFHAEKKHRMYSVSKSFTAVAAGMMIGEGKISLKDKAADYFPEYIPENPHPHILEATVRNLLTMSSFNSYTSYSYADHDWVKTFFHDKGVKHRPGAVFRYDTAATVVLCGIIEKISGRPMLEYMRPVLDGIGFSKDAACIKSPDGRSWTGSGIICTTRDFARFALFCMNKGMWNGKQLVSREYMEAATSKQIDNSITSNKPAFQYGYGYQFWMLKDGGFACNGMGSQLALCMPRQEMILITTADTQAVEDGTGQIIDAYFTLLSKTDGNILPENPAVQTGLKEKISSLSIPLPQGSNHSDKFALYSGKRYTMEDNGMGLKWMSVDIEGEICKVSYENGTGEHSVILGMGYYAEQKFPEQYFGRIIGIKDTQYDCIAAGAWVDGSTLSGIVYAIDEYAGTLKMQLAFSDDNLCVWMESAAEWFFNGYTGLASGWRE